ncbi:MAG TPA: N-acyl homoserine lactonase family protein [Candidatus Binatia bacterium]|nr:N-acyl homoserine lactonase family protein [Candidatus Binatia bacterium]
MTVRVLALTCGWLTAPAGTFLADEPGELRVPVPAFLIEHPRGRVLFDSGMHPDLQTDARARIGWLADYFRPTYQAGEDVAGRLTALGIDPASIRMLINSHLHFDHTGGNALLPNAELVVQRDEWEAGRDADLQAQNAYDPKDYDTGQPVRLVDGEHDVFGDGSVVCVPTFGHTPGHQSLRVRTPAGEVVLTSDACYLRRTLEELRLPPIVHDRGAMLASIARLRALRDAGARLVFGHDPGAWTSVPQAPACLV